MTQQELNQQVAKATGEPLGTVARMGFVPLTHGPIELEADREPLTVDWDELASQRELTHPF